MRTALTTFSESFGRSVRPLLLPFDGALESVDDAADAGLGDDVLPALREVRDQLDVLLRKVEDLQAFVLIFGPLKSGKSTLMNALAGAYVSEVSSLPAYPCMVFVSHADRPSYLVTRYDGRTETYTDSAELQMLIQREHGELAQAIRAAEERGKEFDPAFHLPSAIRRIDVRVRAEELAESGAVLVDTPGLYSRMKFGYDRMTRDFRDAAACAVFVVKTDNVFLEQVFDEFTDLLGLFSRIFLVLNVDSTKRDVGPRGELVPSVEQTDPLRIVEAFESYAMSAPLKEAADEGRLRIYPIDLLHAASRRLRRGEDAAQSTDAEDARPTDEESEPEGEALEAVEAVDPAADDAVEDPERDEDEGPRRGASFEAFHGELTRYLSSNDYLVAFMRDSLVRADTLLDDLEEIRGRVSVATFLDRLGRLELEREEATRRRAAVEALSEVDWSGAADALCDGGRRSAQARWRDAARGLRDELDGALARWFETDASLLELVDEDLLPRMRQRRDDLVAAVERDLREDGGGLRVAEEVRARAAEAGLDLEAVARGTWPRPDQRPVWDDPEAPIDAADVPVRKRLVDWLLLRRRATVRRRLLGPPDRPSQRISVQEKETRLGDEARTEMRRALDRAVAELQEDTLRELSDAVLARQAEELRQAVTAAVDARARELDERLATLRRECDAGHRVRSRLDALAEDVARTRERVAELREESGLQEVEVELVPPSRADEPEAVPEDDGVDVLAFLGEAAGDDGKHETG